MHVRLCLAALALSSVPAAYAADGAFDRTLNFTGAATLSVSTGSGYIHVYPGPDNAVHVIGRVHIGPGWLSVGDADARVQQIVANPPIVQSGNILTIGQKANDNDMLRNVSISYEITAPASSTLQARSGSGSLEIGGIQGMITARTGSGSIKVDNVGGNSRFETGSGSIHAKHVHGAATAETGSGSIELTLTDPGDVQAHTGSGGMHLEGIVAGLRASAGSGSIQVQGNPGAEWRLESGSGSIHLALDPKAHFVLNASTGSGGVTVDRPIVMEGSLNKHHVTGAVNGGGPTVRASTGSGAVSVE
ncbi:MAG: DUF4097 domain-containing protein [Acidobacteriota bacterium]|nr:DUF4097 domain-containing protein [Acidobacteriota bacterium]